MAKEKENTEYLKLASQVVSTMKEHIQNELDINLALSETQKNVLTYIREKTKLNTQNIEFKSSQEFNDFKKSFVDISKERIDSTISRLKKALDDLTPDNMDKTKSALDNIRVSINTEKEFAQKRLDLAGKIANNMVEFIKNNNQNIGNLPAVGAQATFLDKSKGFLNREGKITLLNNQDFNKFKGHIDTFTQSVNLPEINEKIENLVSAMGDLLVGNTAEAQKKLESFRNDQLKPSSKIHKKIKRAFKSAKATLKDIGSSVSSQVSKVKNNAKKTGQEWKEKVKNQINTWRGR